MYCQVCFYFIFILAGTIKSLHILSDLLKIALMRNTIGNQSVLLLGAKLKHASGGSYQKPLKSFGDLTFATQYCTGYTINLSANSPPVSCSTSEDPIGLKGGLNLNSFVRNNPVNFSDPLGTRFVLPSGSMSSDLSKISGGFLDWSTIGMAFQGSIFGLSGRMEIVHYDTKCQHCIKVLVGGGGAGQVISGFAGITMGGGMGNTESDSSGSVGFSYGEGFRASGHSISFPEGGTAGYSFDFGFGGSLFPYEFSGNIMTEIFTKCWKK
jgi:RHS repeat-associated protein